MFIFFFFTPSKIISGRSNTCKCTSDRRDETDFKVSLRASRSNRLFPVVFDNSSHIVYAAIRSTTDAFKTSLGNYAIVESSDVSRRDRTLEREIFCEKNQISKSVRVQNLAVCHCYGSLHNRSRRHGAVFLVIVIICDQFARTPTRTEKQTQYHKIHKMNLSC